MKKCLIISDSESESEIESEKETNEKNLDIISTGEKTLKKKSNDSDKKIYKVTELNYEIQNLIKKKINKIDIVGEITNLSFRNHLYFSLKDNNSKIDCFLWESIYNKTNIEIQNGDKIVCKGTFSLYTKLGKLQLTVDSYSIDGQGELQIKFLQQKKYFENLGYFRNDRKKKLKKYNNKIGIVTSIDSAAYQDVLSVIKRKNPTVHLYVADCRVQGNKCEKDICNSIEKLDKLGLDVIIITRGGGSLEDLWGFNENQLIETIYNCKTIIISAVGHQIDTTLTDYVSDVIAITPSIGGDIAVTNLSDIIKDIENKQENIKNKIFIIIQEIENLLKKKIIRLESLYPIKKLISIQEKIQYLFDKIEIESKHKTEKCLTKINDQKQKLELMNPMNLLKKGYSIIKNEENKSIKSLDEFKHLKEFKLVFSDGEINIKL